MHEHYFLLRESPEDKENQDHHLKVKWKLYWFSCEWTFTKFRFK